MASARLKPVWLGLVVLYLLCVVCLPSLIYPNLPLDTLEHAAWGKQWQWGYAKWPYVSGWLAALAAGLGHPHGWSLYGLSALCVLVAFYYAYAYVSELMGQAMALYACLLSALLYVFYITTLEYNVNLPLLALYAAYLYYFVKAVTYQQYRHWVLVGALVGLGVMTKYTMVLYVFPACCMLLFSKQARRSWCYPGMYVAMLLVLVICLPNLWWLYQHDWISIDYAMHRSAYTNIGKYPFLQHRSYLTHVFYPTKFLFAFVALVLPAILVFLIRQRGRMVWLPILQQDVWLRVLPLAPMLLLLMLAAFGGNVHAAYMLPLLVWVGPSLVLCFRSKPLQGKLWPMCLAVCMVAYSGGYAVVSYAKVHYREHKLTKPFFVGKALGEAAESLWRQHADDRPLSYVLGDNVWWVANAGFYAPSYPQSLFDAADIQREHQSILRSGALLVLPEGAALKPWQDRLAPLKLQATKKVTLTQASHQLSVDMVVFLPS